MSNVVNRSSTASANTILQRFRTYLYSITPQSQSFKAWKNWEKILFRFFFIFLLLLILPLDWKIFRNFFSINWFHLHLHDLFRLSKYQVQFIDESHLPKWGIGAFANWGIAAIIAGIGAAVWSSVDKGKKEYNVLFKSAITCS